jgi:hypothetical protein
MLGLGLGLRLGMGASSAVATDEAYYSALGDPALIPQFGFEFGDITYSATGGPLTTSGMTHSIRTTANDSRIRFELQNTTNDKASGDTDPTKRIEIGVSTPTLANGTELWGAFSSKDTTWSDPAGMLAIGGTGWPFFQVHYGSGGGSPALAFRRGPDGNLVITTRGDSDLGGTVRYNAALSFDAVHDFVYRITLSPTVGAVQVWCDGVSLINLTGISMGAVAADHFWRVGLYYTDGIACPIINERANIVAPAAASLASRTSAAPAWPTGPVADPVPTAPTISARQASVSAATNALTWTPTLATHAAGNSLAVLVSFDSTAGVPDNITTGTAGWTRLTHLVEATGNVGGALFYYGSGGVFTPAPSGATPAPLITCSTSQQYSAIAFTSTDATNIEAVTSSTAAASANGDPPSITPSAGSREYLSVVGMSQDGIAGITNSPSRYGNFLYQASSGSGGAATAIADRTILGATIAPSAFLSATEQHTMLHAVLWK